MRSKVRCGSAALSRGSTANEWLSEEKKQKKKTAPNVSSNQISRFNVFRTLDSTFSAWLHAAKKIEWMKWRNMRRVPAQENNCLTSNDISTFNCTAAVNCWYIFSRKCVTHENCRRRQLLDACNSLFVPMCVTSPQRTTIIHKIS